MSVNKRKTGIIWKTKEGVDLDLADMDTTHLINTAKFCLRVYNRAKSYQELLRMRGYIECIMIELEARGPDSNIHFFSKAKIEEEYDIVQCREIASVTRDANDESMDNLLAAETFYNDLIGRK